MLHNILRKMMHYYTSWAAILHLMYYCGLIDSTYYIALFVFFGGLFVEYIYPANMFNVNNKLIALFFSFVFHLLPFLIIKKENAKICYLFASLLCYFLFFKFEIKKIFEIYWNPQKYIFGDDF